MISWRKPHRSSRVLLVAALLGTSQQAFAAEWFRTEGASCSGEMPLGSAIAALTRGSVSIKAGDGPGNYYVEVNVALLGGGEKITNKIVLDTSNRSTLRTLFDSYAEDMKVPSWFDKGSNILMGLNLPARIGTLSGLLFSDFVSNFQAASSSIKTISMFLADGGTAYRRQAVLKRQSDANRFIVYTDEYAVQVGKENRIFPIYACIYPAMIIVSEFSTSGPANNKILRRTDGATWRMWDVDDGRYEGDPYTYDHQAAGYYYFKRADDYIHRLSFEGGAWQRSGSDGKWLTLYGSVNAQ